MLATHGPLLFNAAGGGWNQTTMGVVVGCNWVEVPAIVITNICIYGD
jgi:hypothetical protein